MGEWQCTCSNCTARIMTRKKYQPLESQISLKSEIHTVVPTHTLLCCEVRILLTCTATLHGNPTQEMPAETDRVTSATRGQVEVLQCQCKDVGGCGPG